MWHLIVPPIVVVACFVFIVWYLSLRGSDPEVAGRVEEMGDTRGGALRLRMKIFSLRMLEKLAQRFKLLSLRVYNGIHAFLQSVKEKRKLSALRQQELEIIAQEKALSQTEESQISADSTKREEVGDSKEESALDMNVQRSERAYHAEALSEENVIVEELKTSHNISMPIRRRQKEDARSDSLVSIRPMISEQAVRPEKVKRKVLERPAEEELIARIATNPKDFTAYEALGDFYMERGSIQDAKECYKQVLKLSPVQRLVKIKIRRLERLLSQK